MIYKLKYMFLLLLVSIGVFSGCAEKGSVSLEEALIAMDSEERVQEAAGTEGNVQTEDQLIYVYVCGAVAKPGVYGLKPDSRIVAAIEAAGGFSSDAATEVINLAEHIKDGMQITVPTLEEEAAREEVRAMEAAGLVNLNTASVTELCTLSGIGEAKAEAIIAYRAEIGAFTSMEQLKEVTGIGESLFNQIKSSIYIE